MLEFASRPFCYLPCLASRVMIISIFSASVIDGHKSIWFLLLSHCVLMLLFFRPQREESNDLTEAWTRKFFLTLSLVFTQIFTFIPFKRDSSSRLLYALFYHTVFINNNNLNNILKIILILYHLNLDLFG